MIAAGAIAARRGGYLGRDRDKRIGGDGVERSGGGWDCV